VAELQRHAARPGLVAGLLAGLGACVTPGAGLAGPAPADPELAYLVSLLDDPVVPLQERLQALDGLQAAGRAAVGPLVTRWARTDDAPFAAERTLPPGPLTPAGPGPGPTTVKQELEALLYRIIDPGWPGPPDPRGLTPRGPYVADWAAWWRAHEQDSLPELRAWAAAARGALRVSPAASGAASAGRLPAPRGPVEAPPPAAPEVQAAFRELQEALRSEAPAAACAHARRLAARHAALARHAAHGCWRVGITPE
jgi:hypothetical protein